MSILMAAFGGLLLFGAIAPIVHYVSDLPNHMTREEIKEMSIHKIVASIFWFVVCFFVEKKLLSSGYLFEIGVEEADRFMNGIFTMMIFILKTLLIGNGWVHSICLFKYWPDSNEKSASDKEKEIE